MQNENFAFRCFIRWIKIQQLKDSKRSQSVISNKKPANQLDSKIKSHQD